MTGVIDLKRCATVLLLAAGMVGALMSHNNPASAQSTTVVPGSTIIVNTAEDESNNDGDCSLREAITAADTNAAVDGCAAGSARERDAIRFSVGQGATTIVLGSRLPVITDPSALAINGGRKMEIVVSGDGKVPVFAEKKGAKLALINLTVADGFADTKGTKGGIGGGVANRGGTLKVTHCTFSGNNAVSLGGGIANLNSGTLKVTNTTFSGNRSGTAGGAVLNDGELKVSYSSFWDNAAEFIGGGINNANDKGATVRLSSTILANSTNGNVNNVCAGGQCRGTITDNGYNISDDRSFRFPARTSKTNTDPRLDPNGLQDNGGPTETIALQYGSPAIGYVPKGENGCGTTVKMDQRWVKRPQGKRCDTGAFERVLQS